MALVAKLATFEDDDRRERRRRLWLSVPTDLAGAEATNVTVHDLSCSGLLVQIDGDLEIGSKLSVELPEAGAVTAEVVWASGSFFGCQFAAPIPSAAVSAALAQSRVVYPDFPLPTGLPPLRPAPRSEAPAPTETPLPEPFDAYGIERGSLSISARILTIVALSMLLWLAISWTIFSLI